MKKLALTTAIILGLSLASFAQGGFFQRGHDVDDSRANNRTVTGGLVQLPDDHGIGNNQDAPLGSGIALLITLSGAYFVSKKRSEE